MTYGRLFPEGFPYLWAPDPDFTLRCPDYKYTTRLPGSRSFCIHPKAGNLSVHGRTFTWTKKATNCRISK
jgi:hypothetical protein